MTCYSILLSVAALAATCACVLGQVTTAQNDVNVLNYALTLERLELAFYTEGQAKFSSSDFTAAGYHNGEWDYFNLIKAHEQAHVNTLVTALGSAANGACMTYTFGLTDVKSYVATALVLESTGVSAYDGAINGITGTDYQQVAATIATIEARHTSFLKSVSNSTDGPFAEDSNGFDTVLSPSAVITKAAPFINTTSCPFDPTKNLPIIRPNGVATTSTLSNAKPSSTNANAAYTQAQFNNDLVALNYALTLEHLEKAFYVDGQSRFTKEQFQAVYGMDHGATYFANFGLIMQHETAHVAALEATINGRQANAAVAVCTYDFSSVTDVASYVATAKVLENTGVMAYDGAVNTITDTGLQQVAATIATVEAKHAAFLNGVTGTGATNTNYMSGNFDQAVAPADILTAVTATKLIKMCPYTPVGPAATAGLPSAAFNAAPAIVSLLIAALVALAAARV